MTPTEFDAALMTTTGASGYAKILPFMGTVIRMILYDDTMPNMLMLIGAVNHCFILLLSVWYL